jgi:hypothetical protein
MQLRKKVDHIVHGKQICLGGRDQHQQHYYLRPLRDPGEGGTLGTCTQGPVNGPSTGPSADGGQNGQNDAQNGLTGGTLGT